MKGRGRVALAGCPGPSWKMSVGYRSLVLASGPGGTKRLWSFSATRLRSGRVGRRRAGGAGPRVPAKGRRRRSAEKDRLVAVFV